MWIFKVMLLIGFCSYLDMWSGKAVAKDRTIYQHIIKVTDVGQDLPLPLPMPIVKEEQEMVARN